MTSQTVGLDAATGGNEPLGAEGEAAFNPLLNTQVILPAANLQAASLPTDAAGQNDLSQEQRAAALDQVLASRKP